MSLHRKKAELRAKDAASTGGNTAVLPEGATELQRMSFRLQQEVVKKEQERSDKALIEAKAKAIEAARRDAENQIRKKAEAEAAARAMRRALLETQQAMAEQARIEKLKQREAQNQLVVMSPFSSWARQMVGATIEMWYGKMKNARDKKRHSGAGAGTDALGDDDGDIGDGSGPLPPINELFDYIIAAFDHYDDVTRDPKDEARRLSEFFMGTLFDDAFKPSKDVLGASIYNGVLCSMFRFALEKAGIHARLYPMPTLSIDLESRCVSGGVITLVARGGEEDDGGRSRGYDNNMFVCLPVGATKDCLSPGGEGAGVLDRVPSFNYLVGLHPIDQSVPLPDLGDVKVLPVAVNAALVSLDAPKGTYDNYAMQIFSSGGKPYLFAASPPSGDATSRAAMRQSLSQACGQNSRKVSRIGGLTKETIADNDSLKMAKRGVSTLMLHMLPHTTQYKKAAMDADRRMVKLINAVSMAVKCFVKWKGVPSDIIKSTGNTFPKSDDASCVSFLSACAPVPRLSSIGSPGYNMRHVMFVSHDKPLILFTGNEASTRATIPGAYDTHLALPMYSGSTIMSLKDMERAEAEKAARGAFAPTTCVHRMREELSMEDAVFTHAAGLDDATIRSFKDPIHGAATMDNGSMTPKGALVVL